MNSQSKILQLQKIIYDSLSPIITSDYVMWGLPYYYNIGDILIWEGDLEFLKKIPFKCLGTRSFDSIKGNKRLFNFIPKNITTTILIQGGGYFGDTWREPWKWVVDEVSHYPDNPIILLPQSLHYDNNEFLEQDIQKLSKLKKLTICLRDKISYSLALKYFSKFATILLVPDMAFCINYQKLEHLKVAETNTMLYLLRNDKEAPTNKLNELKGNVEYRDWPTLEPGFNKLSCRIHTNVIGYRSAFIRKFPFLSLLTSPICDFELKHWFRQDLITIGVHFLSKYQRIRTTRLHVLILSILLGKEVECEDNSYGKLSSFYDTWLFDLDNSKIIR